MLANMQPTMARAANAYALQFLKLHGAGSLLNMEFWFWEMYSVVKFSFQGHRLLHMSGSYLDIG